MIVPAVVRLDPERVLLAWFHSRGEIGLERVYLRMMLRHFSVTDEDLGPVVAPAKQHLDHLAVASAGM